MEKGFGGEDGYTCFSPPTPFSGSNSAYDWYISLPEVLVENIVMCSCILI
jgi:hypothetical protein